MTVASSAVPPDDDEPADEPMTAFPLDALPGPTRQFAMEGAASLTAPPALIAAPAPVVVAAAIGGRRCHMPSSTSTASGLITYRTIMQEPLPPIDWLVEPLFSQGSRAVVFGEFGCMKSWILLDLSLHIAAGRSWLGHFSIPQPRSVLYVDEEMPEQELRRRVKRLGLRPELQSQELPFRVLTHAGVRFEGPELVERSLTDLQAQGFDPDVIIVESLRRVLVGSENDAEAVSGFWHSAAPILAAGKTLVVSHHMRKPNTQGVNDSRHRASGSTDILAGADMAFAIRRTDERLLEVECVKSRVTEESEVFRVRFHEDEADDAVRMEFDGFIEEQGNAESSCQRIGELIVSYLQRARTRESKTSEIDAWLASQHITPSQAEKARKHLKRTGRAINPRYGYWQLRERGLDETSSSANPPISISLAVAAASDEPPRRESTGLAEAEALLEAQVIESKDQDTG